MAATCELEAANPAAEKIVLGGARLSIVFYKTIPLWA